MTPEQISAWQSFALPLAERLNLDPPQYPIGLEVLGSWQDEFGQTRHYTGFIVGIYPALPNWQAGWWYFVHLTSINGDQLEWACAHDECHESELQPLNEPS
jgi:hypothetical protein